MSVPSSIAKTLAVSILSAVLALPSLAAAETFTCTNGDVGCLIASIAKSNANGPAHDYLFLQAGTFMLSRVDNGSSFADGTNGLPVITGALTIVGAGQGVTLLARDPSAPLFRLFEVAPTGGLTVAYVTLQGGEVSIPFFQHGGCVANRGSTLLYHSTVRECSAWAGGALSSRGQVTLLHTTMIENYADFACGGLSASGPAHIESSWIGSNVAERGAGACGGQHGLQIVRSVFQDNVATLANGGGLEVVGTGEIYSTLISDNVSALRGGGLDLASGEVEVSNSTFWGNHADIEGGGAFVWEGQLSLRGVALLFNTAGVGGVASGLGGGIAVGQGGPGRVDLAQTWLLWNEAAHGAQCVGNVTTSGWVVSGNPTAFDTGSPCD